MVGVAKSQEVAKMSQIVALGKDLRRKKGIVGRQDVVFPCYEIRETDEFTGDNEAYMNSVFDKYRKSLERTNLNLGFALNFDYDYSALGDLTKLVINNFGDPFIETNFYGHSRQFELGVLDWFANLWEIEKDEYWGYVTNGGTEGNLHGILVGRELFPDGVFYTSKESHYSIFKAAQMYRMNCVKVDTLVTGEMDCEYFKAKLLQNKHKPAIVNVTLGSTLKGAIDDLDRVIQVLEECGYQQDRFYIHCDTALYGLMLPFMKGAPQITFKKPIGSVCVSGHKFIGCPMPCGVYMTKLKHINVLSKEIEYIGSRDSTITGSRSGHTPIYLWYALNQKGYRGLEFETHKCLRNARYLKDQLKKAGFSVMLNKSSNLVVIERPQDEEFIRRWQLSCQGNIAHVAVMPCITTEKLDTFVREWIKKRSIWLKDGRNEAICFAPTLGQANCSCDIHRKVRILANSTQLDHCFE